MKTACFLYFKDLLAGELKLRLSPSQALTFRTGTGERPALAQAAVCPSKENIQWHITDEYMLPSWASGYNTTLPAVSSNSRKSLNPQ